MSEVTEMDILRRGYERENDPKVKWHSWSMATAHCDKDDLDHLVRVGLIEHNGYSAGTSWFRLTAKGNEMVKKDLQESLPRLIPRDETMKALEPLIGYEDVKKSVANALAVALKGERRAHFLFKGKPGCGKSVILDAVASVCGDESYTVFGDRLSGPALNEILFNIRPKRLIVDEIEKARDSARTPLLALMEKGDLVEDVTGKRRGASLPYTVVFAACNTSEKLKPEVISRFGAGFLAFPDFTEEQFIQVCISVLIHQDCPEDVAFKLSKRLWDLDRRDVRTVRGCWNSMQPDVGESYDSEMERVIGMMVKYSPNNAPPTGRRGRQKNPEAPRLL